jgi:hypothetical protein
MHRALLVATASANADADGAWNARANAYPEGTPTTHHAVTNDAAMHNSTTNPHSTAHHSSSMNCPTPTDAD